jgi:uncharacterized RDD family membrane protein YckC
MEKIKISTTQNVDIEYTVASAGDRILAFITDILIKTAYIIVFSVILQNTGNPESSFIFMVLFIILPIMFYELILEILLNGQTLGKKFLKIRVVRIDGTSPSILNYIMRWILSPVDIWFTSGMGALLTIIITGKGQRIGDLAAGTCVVKLKENANITQTMFAQINENYEIKYPEVINLNDTDINTIKDLLKANSNFDLNQKVISANLRAKELLEKKMNIKSDLHPLTFFKTLIIDYNHEHGKFE